MYKIYTIKKKIVFSSEMIILFGLLDDLPKEALHCYNCKGLSRYGNVINWCKEHIEYVNNIMDADFVVLPFKFKNVNDPVFQILDKLTKNIKKKLWCFYNDDDDTSHEIDDNVILFRTSFYKSNKKENEKAMIAISPDYYRGKISDNISIGYCGYYTAYNRRFPDGIFKGRAWYINYLNKCKVPNSFIIRKGFWAQGLDKSIARKQYFENMENNIFMFCIRGAGNFSYRFYEILMMGRIPIFIDTDCVLPFEKLIKKAEVGIFINESDIISNKINLEQEILRYIENNKNKLPEIQKQNRLLWEKLYSPIGFLNMLLNTENLT